MPEPDGSFRLDISVLHAGLAGQAGLGVGADVLARPGPVS
jgi:hypothetical protein